MLVSATTKGQVKTSRTMLAAKIPAATFLSLLLTCPFENDDSSGSNTTGNSGNTFTSSSTASDSEPPPDSSNSGNSGAQDSSGPVVKPKIVQASASQTGTCALDDQGRVYCWGRNNFGQLGQGHTVSTGAETPANVAGPVPLSQRATMIASGQSHTCAILEDDSVICWGEAFHGSLGRGNANHIGNNETPGQLKSIRIGVKARSIHAGWHQSCAISHADTLHCWGSNRQGQLGYGHNQHIGNDDPPLASGPVDAGGPVKDVALSQLGTCALLKDGAVRCWGYKRPATGWHEGTPRTNPAIGDDEVAAQGRLIDLPGPAAQIEAGLHHMCARLQDHRLYCWGESGHGQLGQATDEDAFIKNSPPTTPGPLALQEHFSDVSLGGNRSCAITSDGAVYCWGSGILSKPGDSKTSSHSILLSESPRRIALPGPAKALTNGQSHSCAILDQGLYCWGQASLGALGYGNMRDIGQNEDMNDFGPVPVLDGQGPGVEIPKEVYDGRADYSLSMRWPFGAPPKALSSGEAFRFQGTYEQITTEGAADIGRITRNDEIIMLWFDSEGSPTQYPTQSELSTWDINRYEWAYPFTLRATEFVPCPPLELDEDVEVPEDKRDELQGRRLTMLAMGNDEIRGGEFLDGHSGTVGGGYFFDVHDLIEWKGLEHISNPTVDFGYHENRRAYNIIQRDCKAKCERTRPTLACDKEREGVVSHIYGGFIIKQNQSYDSFDPVFDIDCKVLSIEPENDKPNPAYDIELDCIGITQRRRFPGGHAQFQM